jgi:magnesium transporter
MGRRRKNLISVVKLLKPEIEELLKNKNYRELKDVIINWEPADIAELLDELEKEEAIRIFLMLPKNLQVEVFSEFDGETQKKIIESLKDEEIKTIISGLAPDDRTSLFEEIAPNLTRKLLDFLSPNERREALTLLGYPKNSVGRLMTPDYVAIKPEWTIKKAIEHIRKYGKDAETINMIYVVDDDFHLVDDIPLRRIILSEPEQKVEEIMDFQFISISPYEDQEKAIEIMKKYNLVALPVTDNDNYLLGIVTIDDIIDVMEEEQTEDITKISAIHPTPVGLELITKIKEIPIIKLYKSRVVWLLFLLLMDLFTGGIIQGFQQTIAKYVVLVTFLPVVIDTAGNAGSQSATLVIRAMALKTVEIKDWLYLLLREIAVSFFLGITMGIGISFMGIIRSGSIKVAVVVVVAMILNVIAGCVIGILLPFLFAKFKKDPATASTPLITTLADIIGTAIYLGTATIFLI